MPNRGGDMTGKGNPMGKDWGKNLTEEEAPYITPLSVQNIPKRDFGYNLNTAQFQEYVLQERIRNSVMLEDKISLAIRPKPAWLTEKAWRWLLQQLLVMKYFVR